MALNLNSRQSVTGNRLASLAVHRPTILMFGTAAATAGVAASRRDCIADRARDLLDRED